MAKVTIFGLAGTGTTSAGKILAEKLGYKFMSSGNIFREMAKEKGMALWEFEELSAKDPRYDRELDERMKKFGEENNNFVVESRLAWHFIPDSIKIKLICDFETRVGRVSSRDRISFAEAEEKTKHRERFIFKRYERYYGIKDFDDKNFDLVIDTTSIKVPVVVERISKLIA